MNGPCFLLLLRGPTAKPVIRAPSARSPVKKNFFNVYFWERQCVSRGVAEKEGDTEPQAGSRLSAQSLMRGSNSRTVRSRPEPKSGHLTAWATQVPLLLSTFAVRVDIVWKWLPLALNPCVLLAPFHSSFWIPVFPTSSLQRLVVDAWDSLLQFSARFSMYR